ncbi:MAG: FtsW/RodA/SpoVE family cell cycle protein [Bacilli bacterium]|nr:FtsW/RodA/SpoVE family cell cycle protein [Bacilli bacterium]
MKILRKIDKPLLIISVILFAIGLVAVYSASNVTAFMLNDADPSRYFAKEAFFLFSGFLVCFIIIKVPTKGYGGFSWLFTLVLIGVIVVITILGQVINGMSAWINYNGLGIQPSEFIKITIIPLIATFYDRNYKYRNNMKVVMIPMIVAMVAAASIVFQGDLGTAIIFIGLCGLMFFFSPVSNRIKFRILGLILIFAAFLGILIMAGGDKILPADKLARFDFKNPCEKYITTGNQLCNSYIAINGGGLTGKGLGNSTQKYLYLPEAHTDFIFSIFVEELGILGAVVLISLYFVLIVRIIVIGKMSPTIAKKMICYGVSFYLFMHIIVNLTGVLGILPMTGVPLPFMSYGGSICWCTLLALTMVQRISYENNTKKA